MPKSLFEQLPEIAAHGRQQVAVKDGCLADHVLGRPVKDERGTAPAFPIGEWRTTATRWLASRPGCGTGARLGLTRANTEHVAPLNHFEAE